MNNEITEFLMYFDNDKNIEKAYSQLNINNNYLILLWNQIGLNEYIPKALPMFNLIFLNVFAITAQKILDKVDYNMITNTIRL